MSNKKSIKSVLILKEDVVDRTKSHGKALENMGIRRNEIKTKEDLVAATQQLVSQVSFGLKALQAIAKQASPDVNIDATVNDVISSLDELKSSLIPIASPQSPSSSPEERFKKANPYRGYRSGE